MTAEEEKEERLASLTSQCDVDWNVLDNSTKFLIKKSIDLLFKAGATALTSEVLLFCFLDEKEEEGVLQAQQWFTDRNISLKRIMAELRTRPLWVYLENRLLEGHVAPNLSKLGFSYGTEKIFKLVPTFVHSAEILNPLLFMLVIYCEGTSVAADVLQKSAKSALNVQICCQVAGIDSSILSPTGDFAKDKFDMIRLGKLKDSHLPLQPFSPNHLRDLNIDLIKEKDAVVPYSESNWVIYPNLLIGGNPSTHSATIHNLLFQEDPVTGEDISRTTIVCLMGEFGNIKKYSERSYCNQMYTKIRSSGRRPIECIYFPIHDFETTEVDPLVNLVTEIKRRILSGERVLLHCRGGHGRTGMVIIPLVAAIYQLPFDKASAWVKDSYDASNRGQSWQWRLPETREQKNLAKAVTNRVRKYTRGQPKIEATNSSSFCSKFSF